MNNPIYNIFVYFTTVYSSSSNILFTSPWLKQLVCSKSVSLISSLNLLHVFSEVHCHPLKSTHSVCIFYRMAVCQMPLFCGLVTCEILDRSAYLIYVTCSTLSAFVYYEFSVFRNSWLIHFRTGSQHKKKRKYANNNNNIQEII